jgi:hypothetical protein
MTGPLPPGKDGPARLVTDPHELAGLSSHASRFVAGLASEAPGEMINNFHSQPMLMVHGDRHLPVTLEDGRAGGSYVASPHSAYVLYARDEIDIIGLTGASRLAAHGVLAALDAWLKAVAINRTVHLDNWLLSTSLHGAWDGTGLAAMRHALIEAFPDHLPVLRCVDEWSCPELLATVKADGWTLLHSRQIWVTDDLEAQWRPRSHAKSDLRAMRKSGLQVEEIEAMTAADASRIAELYEALYRGRYSPLNPAYTSAFVEHACTSGALRWRVARGRDGRIMASAGMRVAGGIVTVPMLGYDTSRPQSEALYRIASLLSSEWTMERGYRYHGSAGAGTFKANRGARGVIEYMAVHTGHLAPARRTAIGLLAAVMERTMVPALRKQGW